MSAKVKRTVLITTSGTGSRLGTLTKYTNKSLVKVGDKYAICRILDSHPKESKFVITLGYHGNLVRDFLELAYPEYDFTFVEVDIFEGEGSSLVYSMLKASPALQTEFYFHCCDTILKGPVPDVCENTLFVTKEGDSATYASVIVKGDKILQMNKKGYQVFDYFYIGLSYIKEFKAFWEALQQIYEATPYDQGLSDIHGVQKLLNAENLFRYQVLDGFFDTGNLESYKKTCQYFKDSYNILTKDNESLCFLENDVIKFLNDSEMNRKRWQRGLDLYPLVPKITGKKPNFLKMEFVKGKVLSEVYLHGEVFSLLTWAQQNLWTEKRKSEENRKACLNFYKKKTLARLTISKTIVKEKNRINGLEIPPALRMLDILDFDWVCTDTLGKFHGDFILDNILKTEDGYCLLDWRQEFDTGLFIGDIYYDLAKLRHNIIFNHKNIVEDLYTIEERSNEIFLDLKCNYLLMNQLEDFERFCSTEGYDNRKIKVLTAIIWLNMSPLYEGKLSEFLFYFGKYNLYLSIFRTNPEGEQHPIVRL